MRGPLFVAAVVTGLTCNMAWAQFPRYAPPPPPYGSQVSEGDMIADWYRRFLNREPEPGAVEGWVNQVRSGTSLDWVEAQILGGEEFWGKAGSTPQGFIRTMFQKVVNRQPTPSELE